MQWGDWKLVRQELATKTPGPWQVYDLATDPGETRDVAAAQADLIRRTEDLLRREVDANAAFPVAIPGVNTPGQ